MSWEKQLLDESNIEKQILHEILDFNIFLKNCFDGEERRAMALNEFVQHMARKYRNKTERKSSTKINEDQEFTYGELVETSDDGQRWEVRHYVGVVKQPEPHEDRHYFMGWCETPESYDGSPIHYRYVRKISVNS